VQHDIFALHLAVEGFHRPAAEAALGEGVGKGAIVFIHQELRMFICSISPWLTQDPAGGVVHEGEAPLAIDFVISLFDAFENGPVFFLAFP